MRFFGSVGFAIQTETSPGVTEDLIVERQYYGDVVRNSRRLESASQLNDNVRINNSFSIVADAFAQENFHSIRYIEYMGVKWKADSVDAATIPRIVIDASSVYNPVEGA